MNHDEFRAAYLERRLGAEERRHLSGCVECPRSVPRLDAILEVLAGSATWDEPSADLRERVVGAFQEERPAPPHTIRGWWKAAVPAAAIAMAIVAWLVTRPPAPDWTVELPGVAQSGDAMGTVEGWNVEAGTKMEVHIEGLSPAPAGFVYEFWMTHGRNHVSAGSFVEADSVELLAGVGRRDFPRLWITMEPLDGNPAPTGAVVLDTG